MEVTKIDGRLRFCRFETQDGLTQHYICSHQDYCCALGCCASSAVTFYQLWYFWLLLLLIILLCTGGGWWYRWRNGPFSSPRRSPAHNRRHGRRRSHNSRAHRVFPNTPAHGGHSYYSSPGGQNDYTFPPGYDKDPPSYQEVISHLHQFPRPLTISSFVDNAQEGSNSNRGWDKNVRRSGVSEALQNSLPGTTGDAWLSVPPPPYDMVLELKRKEHQLDTEIAQEEQQRRAADQGTGEADPAHDTRERIKKLLGKGKKCPSATAAQASESGQPSSSSASPSSATASTSSAYHSGESSPSTSAGAPFIISTENLPYRAPLHGQDVAAVAGTSMASAAAASSSTSSVMPRFQPPVTLSASSSIGSFSDYNSSLGSSPPSNAPSARLIRLASPGAVLGSPPPLRTPELLVHTVEDEVVDGYEAEVSEAQVIACDAERESSPSISSSTGERGVDQRPQTGRSVLSRPCTSISTRSLPMPNAERKPSLPGTVMEADDEKEDDDKQQQQEE
ncbi:uncharacterized protein LOC143019691 [Oratosquilla oratoria]|uniref:uncharacterized protein LOC143019691 n=1 Tax=Oratosquilla oratoria TaxID=337810 RepID=UPI003F760154